MLLSIEEYQKLTGCQTSIVELLAMPDALEIEFEPERAVITPRSVDLS